jgi:hypothetical protein
VNDGPPNATFSPPETGYRSADLDSLAPAAQRNGGK